MFAVRRGNCVSSASLRLTRKTEDYHYLREMESVDAFASYEEYSTFDDKKDFKAVEVRWMIWKKKEKSV